MASSLAAGACVDMYHGYRDDAEARLAERRLVSALTVTGLYVDAAFAASGTSLYLDALQPPKFALPSEVIEWNRLAALEVAGCSEPGLCRSARPGVTQGALRDRWFLNALALVSPRPDLVRRLVVSAAHATRGLYTCKFYKGGRWRYVHVDDRIPCNKSGAAHFARSPDPNEVFAIVLEKAYAKLHGSYDALQDGNFEDAIRDVTGEPVSVFRFDDGDVAPRVLRDEGGLFEELAEHMARGSVVGVADTKPDVSRQDPAGSRATRTGLMKHHTYPILELKRAEADATTAHDAIDLKFVKVANPWGRGAWRGRWGPKSPLWAQYQPIAEACGVHITNLAAKHKKQAAPPPPARGERKNQEEAATSSPSSSFSGGEDAAAEFWMEWSDFVAQFDTCMLTYAFEEAAQEGSTAKQYRGQWLPADPKSGAGGGPACFTWPTNPQYLIDVPEATRFCATLAQADARWHNNKNNNNKKQGAAATATGQQNSLMKAGPAVAKDRIGVAILSTDTGRRQGKYRALDVVGGTGAYATRGAVSATCYLLPGSYTVVPATFHPSTYATPFILDLRADKPVNFTQADDEMLDLDLDDAADDDVTPADLAAAEAIQEAGHPPLVFEPEAREVHHLWEQAAHLATVLKNLDESNARLSDRIRQLEIAKEAADQIAAAQADT